MPFIKTFLPDTKYNFFECLVPAYHCLQFLDLCEREDVESVKTLLAKDPSLINSKDTFGNINIV